MDRRCVGAANSAYQLDKHRVTAASQNHNIREVFLPVAIRITNSI